MEVARELVVKISHLQEKSELVPLADLIASLAEHEFTSNDLMVSGLSKLGARAAAWRRSPWRARAAFCWCCRLRGYSATRFRLGVSLFALC